MLPGWFNLVATRPTLFNNHLSAKWPPELVKNIRKKKERLRASSPRDLSQDASLPRGVIGLVYLHMCTCTPTTSPRGSVRGFKQYFRIQHVIKLNTPITGVKAHVGRFFSISSQINQSINSQIEQGEYTYVHNGISLSLSFFLSLYLFLPYRPSLLLTHSSISTYPSIDHSLHLSFCLSVFLSVWVLGFCVCIFRNDRRFR